MRGEGMRGRRVKEREELGIVVSVLGTTILSNLGHRLGNS